MVSAEFLLIGVWPILMGLTMFQQKLTTTCGSRSGEDFHVFTIILHRPAGPFPSRSGDLLGVE